MDYPQYDPHSPVTPLAAAELAGLDALLAQLPQDGAMTLDGLDGYLTALLVGPPSVLTTLPTAEWLPGVWGGDGLGGAHEAAPFTSKRQRKATVVLVLRHLRHLNEQISVTPQAWEPIFSIAEQGAAEWADARDWCTGFLQAVDLDVDAWGPVWADPALAPLLLLGGGLEGGLQGRTPMLDDDASSDLGDPAACDALSRAVPDGVLQLHARFHAAG